MKYKIFHWIWKTFYAPRLIRALGAAGEKEAADAVEKARRSAPPASQEEMVQATINKLINDGRMDDALKFKEVAAKVTDWQKNGEKRPF